MATPETQINIPASALVVLIGVAGSGKSTFANAHFRATEILSSDHFRAMVSDDAGDQEATADAFLLLHVVLEKRLRRGKLCVVDATNLNASHRAKLIALARLDNRPTLAIVFDTPEDICIERAGARMERVVRASVIREQAEKLALQTSDSLLREGFQDVARITPLDQVAIRLPNAFTVWLTGLSGAGKSTLAQALSAHLHELSVPHKLLDGDELRRTLCRDLAFSKGDRDENVRRIAALASDLNRDQVVAIVAAIAPYREARGKARGQCERFVEVFVDCSLETLMQRDPKGLYRRALAGELPNFSGVSDPYEPPEHPEIYLNSGIQTLAESVEHLLSKLTEFGYLAKPA